MKNIFRKIKLNDLGFYECNDIEKELLNSIKYYFVDYPNYIFYFKHDICIYSFNFEYKRYNFSDSIVDYFRKYKNGVDIIDLLNNEIGEVSFMIKNFENINNEYYSKNKIE